MKLHKFTNKIITFLLTGSLLAGIPICANAAEAVLEIETSETEEFVSYQEVNDPHAQLQTKGDRIHIESDRFQVEIASGLEGHYRVGAQMPVTIWLTSQESDFTGKVRLIVPRTYDWNSPDTTAYEMGVLLPEESQKQYEFSLSNRSSAAYFYLEIEDEAGKSLLKQMIPVKATTSEMALTGILSDDYPALSYFDKSYVSSEEYSGNAELIELDEKNFPENAKGLDALSFLIISSFDTERLSEAQQEALKEWVSSGGALILGGGADYQQTCALFEEELQDFTIKEAQSGTMTLSNVVGDSLLYAEADHLFHFESPSAANVGVFAEDDLLRRVDYGNGVIFLTAFNPGMEPVVSWELRNKLAAELLSYAGGSLVGHRISAINYGDSAYNLQFEADFPISTPNMIYLMVLLLLFAVALPILYFILKKLDKAILIWYLVPCAAILVSGIVLLSTTRLRLKQNMVNSVTLLEQKEEEMVVQRNVNFQILMPKTGWNTITFTDRIHALKAGNDYNGYSYPQNEPLNENYECVFGQNGANSTYAYRNSSIFNTRSLFGELNDAKVDGQLEIHLMQSDNGLKGTVTNHTGMNLKGLVLFTRGQYYSLGSLAEGETFDLAVEDYREANYLWDLEWMDISDEREESVLRGMYSTIDDQLFGSYYRPSANRKQCALVGYVEQYDTDYIADENVTESNHAIYYAPFNLRYEGYEDAMMFSLREFCEASDAWDYNDGEIYQTDFYTRADIGDYAEKIYVLKREEHSAFRYGETRNTKVWAWNYDTGEFNLLFEDGNTITFEDHCPYLQDGMMELHITCKYEYDDYVPEIIVIGGKEDAGN